MVKLVTLVALILFFSLETSDCFVFPNVASLHINSLYADAPIRKQLNLLELKCSDASMLRRRSFLVLPFSFPLLVSAVEQDTKGSAQRIPEKDAVDASGKPSQQNDSSKKSENTGYTESNSLAMKECDTPPKQESKKQEICEVDY
jgi:hypothetical protein